MTVQVQTPFIEHIGNGLTTVFAYDFLVLELGDISIELDGVPLVGGFSASGIGDSSGGNITFVTAPASLVVVLIKRILPLSRSIDYQENGDFLADTVNNDFDRIWLALQQAQQYFKSALKLPFNTTTDQIITEVAADRVGKVVSFDALGNMILANLVTGIANVSAFMLTVLTAVNAAAARATLGTTAAHQAQTETAFTTTGTAPNYVVTTSPSYGAYSEFKRMFLKIHSGTLSGAANLNQDDIGNKSIKQKDAAGNKINPFLPTGFTADVEYDGIDWIVQNPLPPSSNFTSLRQITGATTLTDADLDSLIVLGGAGTYTVTLPASSAVKAGRGVTFFSQSPAITIAPNSGDSIIKNYVSGSASIVLGSTETLRVNYFGSAIWMPDNYIDKYNSGQQTITTTGTLTLNHGLKRAPTDFNCYLICTTAENGFSVGNKIPANLVQDSANFGASLVITNTQFLVRFGSSATVFGAIHFTTGVSVALTNANWRFQIEAEA